MSTQLMALGIDIKGISSQPVRQETHFGIDGKTGLTITVPEMTKHLAHVGLKNSIFLEPLPSLLPASLATATITPLDCDKCDKHRIPRRFRFGMVSHIGLTGAHRAASNQFLDIGALNQKGAGYGSGFSFGFKRGRSEIELGLLYSAKTYHPNIVDTYGTLGAYREKHFTGINLQTLQIPVNIRHNVAVLGDGKWHLYIQGGVAANVILRAQYDISARPQPTTRWTQGISATSRLNSTNFNQGILGGDPLKDNRFFTFNFGVGAEYYLSPKWSVFMQPDFHNYISQSRIGPTQDKINSLSLSFGVKTSFY